MTGPMNLDQMQEMAKTIRLQGQQLVATADAMDAMLAPVVAAKDGLAAWTQLAPQWLTIYNQFLGIDTTTKDRQK